MPDPREPLGRLVRETWVAWAIEQGDTRPSHLAGWDDLDPGNREVDMRIGEAVAAAGASEPGALLAAMIADLDGYITRRAQELAAPVIAAAEQSVRDEQAMTAGAVQHGDDLARELGRRLASLERQNERLRRHVAELEADDA